MRKDLIYAERPKSMRKPMSMLNRAAQFSPFAALTGYDDHVKEAARLTDAEIELDDSIMEGLDQKLAILDAIIQSHPEITITYFEKDLFKEGGKYTTYTGNLKKIDEYSRKLFFMDKSSISISTITAMESEVFTEYE